ncbi:MAG: LacI family DNA-binding transcriptional regulator [Rhizobiaceae bacterium]|nr:LacI family DNA-binding transcriptional regulator [Rhizobiaceae bacterium]
MSVTLKEVAEKAGVSRSAVSRTFTPGASVSKETRRKVERAAKELGYHPSALARALTTGRTKLVGLVSNNFSNPAFLEIFDLFTRGLQDQGLRPLLLNLSGETDSDHSVRMLQQYSVDGVIVASSTIDRELASRFRKAGIPTVQAFGRASPDVHNVGIDNVDCGRLAARTLHGRGYRRIGFLGGPASATSTQDRLRGFEEEAKRLGDLLTTVSYCAAYSFDAGYKQMGKLISDGNLPEAFFCGDDVLAIGALSAAQHAGLSVPDDLGLLGLNDMEMAGWANINMTTIRQPFSEIIGSAIELMVSLLDRPDRSPETRIFSCRVVERKTLRRTPAESEAARAIAEGHLPAGA